MRLTLLLASFILTSVSAFGQAAEFSFSAGVNSISGGDLGSGYSIEGGPRFGFRITLNNWRFFGHEFGYAYNRTKLSYQGETAGTAAHQGLYHFLAYGTSEGHRIRPFASGGVHFTNFIYPGQSVTYGGGSTKFGVNYGAGIKVRLTTSWLVRADVRQYLTGKPFDFPGASGSLKQNEFAVGIGFGL